MGVTGPPGAGKSTLVAEYALLLRRESRRVGVVAVDPTSPYTGGAILGDRAYLASKGVRVSLQGHQPFQAAVRAIHDTLKALGDGTAPADLKNLASNELMAKVTRSADYAGWTRDFLGGVGKG